ncbi:ATP-dependent Clp protease ATP-binding subunit [Runella slithyformis]|uniref:ATPase AAA-2 domain protein n=1 Tax=Runella slithyformis (strain ATCC 29530 / DSM 19594 / LMG 11500 / NCIMB 11436 / LSU 4) TaxID=761193 RepID=A0A7U3ZQJ8_RUNSL|nr:ATP-dependent Clp protease ATP-binding subunit [Runella slithyformis]AEI51511.1 ATPase AAA-2 domain protein [Runella slithyformis DSM 19594]
MISTQLNDELIRAIQIAQAIAKEHQQGVYAPAHLLKGLLHNDVGLGALLVGWEIDINYLRDWADYRIEKLPKSARGTLDMRPDPKTVAALEVADIIRLKLGDSSLSPLAVLIAITRPEVAYTKDQLKSFPITETELLTFALQNIQAETTLSPASDEPSRAGGGNASFQALLKYCVDKTALARQGKLDPIIGRDKETRTMVEILGRRSKPNVIIVGEPGVGKTALVEGLARLIIAGQVPAHLQKAALFQLDMGALIAGASYKGEIEDRLKNIIAEVKRHERALLFIDEIHVLMDPQSGAMGLVNLLKPELARGELTVIGATTLDEFRKFMEPDEAFSRRFELVRVDEPDETTASRMVGRVVPLFEEHHQIKVGQGTVVETVRLARRYIKDRRLPDAAIDLIDRTMAAMKLMTETTQQEIDLLRTELTELREEHAGGDPILYNQELRWFERQLRHRLSPILLGQLEEDTQLAQMELPEAVAELLTELLIRLQTLGGQRKETVETHDVAAVVAHKTGIPLGKLQSTEREKLLQLNEHLKKRVVGQDHATKVIADAILENRSGLSRPGQPIGSFFFSGPTGTGKTELAKTMADFLFNDEKALIRFDMSEFKEEHSAAVLYGAPPGYVGYEEGGLLVTKIRQQPFAIVLFDEIEKAHPSVFDLFLQILDEGTLHDRLGREGDFSNAIILFTSNIGSEWIAGQFGQGQIPASNDILDLMTKHFRPEFLGRLTEIIPFSPITESAVLNIFNIQLKPLIVLLEKQGITLNIDDEARKALALEGFTPKYGARPIRGVIRNRIRRPLSRMIVAGEIGKGSTVTLKLGKDGEFDWENEPIIETIH